MSKVRDVDKGWSAIALLAKSGRVEGRVGWFAGQHVPARRGDARNLSNAQLIGILYPARPVLEVAFDRARPALEALGAGLAREILAGRTTPKAAVGLMCSGFVDGVKAGVRSRALGLKPNARRTIARKGSSTPLVDAGALLGQLRFYTRTV